MAVAPARKRRAARPIAENNANASKSSQGLDEVLPGVTPQLEVDGRMPQVVGVDQIRRETNALT